MYVEKGQECMIFMVYQECSCHYKFTYCKQKKEKKKKKSTHKNINSLIRNKQKVFHQGKKTPR